MDAKLDEKASANVFNNGMSMVASKTNKNNRLTPSNNRLPQLVGNLFVFIEIPSPLVIANDRSGHKRNEQCRENH